jgi:hypothetical protein
MKSVDSLSRSGPRRGLRTKHGAAIGLRRGHLVVVDIVDARCRVRCDCGAERLVYGSSLGWHRKRGVQVLRCSKTCPMPPQPREAKRDPHPDAVPRGMLRQLRQSARKRGIRCTLTVSDIKTLRIGQPCHYCAGQLSESAPGFDRIDNAGHYTVNNVVVCCTMCNWARGGWLSYDEFRAAMAVRLARTGPGNAWPEASTREALRIGKIMATIKGRK